jgi:WD40 repeat protein
MIVRAIPVCLTVFLSIAAAAQKPELGLSLGHTRAITSVAWSPDGQYVLTGSSDNQAKLWDRQGNVLRTFNIGNSDHCKVGFSPKGNFLFTQTFTRERINLWKECIIWDTRTGSRVFKTDGEGIFSPDEQYLLCQKGDSTWLRNNETKTLRLLTPKPLMEMSFSSDSKRFLLTDWGDKKVMIGDVQSGRLKQLRFLNGFWLPYDGIQFIPGRDEILVTRINGDVFLFNLKGKLLQSIGSGRPLKYEEMWEYGHPHDSLLYVSNTGFTNDGRLFYHSSAYVAVLYETGDGVSSKISIVERLDSCSVYRHIVQISSDGKYLLVRDALNTIGQVLDAKGKIQFSARGLYGPNPDKDKVEDLRIRAQTMAFSPDGTLLLVGYDNGHGEICQLDGTPLIPLNSENTHKIGRAFFSAETDLLLFQDVPAMEDPHQESPGGRNNSPLDWRMLHLEDGRVTVHKMAAVESMASFYPAIDTFLHQSAIPTDSFATRDGSIQIKGYEAPYVKMEDFSSISPYERFIKKGSADGVIVRDHSGIHHFFRGSDYSISDVFLTPDAKYLLLSPSWEPPTVWNFGCLLNETTKFDRIDLLNKDSCLLRTLDPVLGRNYFLCMGPDNNSILLKDHAVFRLVSLDGKILQTFRGHSLDVRGACYLKDGQLILSWSDDHTQRIWDASTGVELARLILLNEKDWLLTTPSGLFDATPGAMAALYYVVGIDKINIEQLKERYYDPGLLQKILGTNLEPQRSVETLGKIDMYPLVYLTLDTFHNSLKIKLQPRNGGLGKLSIFINGKEVAEDANPPKGLEKLRDTLIIFDLSKYAQYFFADTLNTVSVRAYNKDNWLKSAAISVEYQPVFFRGRGGSGTSTETRKTGNRPAFYAIVVGTSNYAGNQLDLNFAGQDAIAMAAAFEQAGKSLFGADSVFIQLLTTDTTDSKMHPSKANIKAAFDNIMKKPAKAEDILMVYLSGHGITYGEADKSLFYYLTKDCINDNLSAPDVRANSTISSEELTKWINTTPPQKQVLVLDACNSGKMAELLNAIGAKSLDGSQVRAFDRMKDRTGMFLLAGSAADKKSYEVVNLGHGLLTYVLLNGMNGLKLTKDKLVDVRNLFEYAIDEVPNLSKTLPGNPEVQRPMLASPLQGSFEIGRVEQGLNIPMNQTKPVFIRNIFLNEDRLTDDLKLTSILEAQYSLLTAKPAQASFIYHDVPFYPEGYFVNGLYTIKEGKVTVGCHLFKGDKGVAEFEVTGSASDTKGLVNQILGKMTALIQK